MLENFKKEKVLSPCSELLDFCHTLFVYKDKSNPHFKNRMFKSLSVVYCFWSIDKTKKVYPSQLILFYKKKKNCFSSDSYN